MDMDPCSPHIGGTAAHIHGTHPRWERDQSEPGGEETVEPMADRMSVGEAAAQLVQLADEMAGTRRAVAVVRDGQPVMALVSWELYESIVQALNVLNDPRVMAAVRQMGQGADS